MATVQERVQTLVADKLGVAMDEVVPEASFTEDLNADSLDLVELIMAFEEEFGSDDSPLAPFCFRRRRLSQLTAATGSQGESPSAASAPFGPAWGSMLWT